MIPQEDNHCNRQYQRFMDLEERAVNPGQNAYCLVEDNKCPYYAQNKLRDYCRLSIKDGGIEHETRERRKKGF